MNTLDQKLQQLGVTLLMTRLLGNCAFSRLDAEGMWDWKVEAASKAQNHIMNTTEQLLTNIIADLQTMESARPLVAMLTSIDAPPPIWQWADWIDEELDAQKEVIDDSE